MWIRDLLEGVPAAWALLIGILPGIFLGFVASKAKMYQGTKKTDPDEIIAESQKRCARGLVSGLVVYIVAILVAVAVGSPIAMGVIYFVGSFLLTLIACVNARCPACGSLASVRRVPTHGPKCGVRLK